MNTLEIVCKNSSCQRKFLVRPEFSGRQTRCPGCREVLVVGVSVSRPTEDLPPPPRKKRSRPIVDPDDSIEEPRINWSRALKSVQYERISIFMVFISAIAIFVTIILTELFERAFDGLLQSLFIVMLIIITASPIVILVVILFISRMTTFWLPEEITARTPAKVRGLLFLGTHSAVFRTVVEC
ncbi:MAG: hypothetical protein R3B84_11400 [Zavarzinella sp.]